MATTKTLILLFVILAPATIILAQESNSSSPDGSEVTSIRSSVPPHNDNGPVASSAPGLFRFPKFDFKWPEAGFFATESRHKRSPDSDFEDESDDEPEDEEHSPELKAFRFIRCNFRTEGRSRCTSCNTIRRCYPFNIGTVSTCSFLFPYCRNGQCSRIKGPLCYPTTSTSSTTTKASSGSDASSSGSDATSSDSNSSSSGSDATSSDSNSSSSGSSSSDSSNVSNSDSSK